MPGHLRLCKSTTLLLMLAHNGELGLCRALVDRWLPLTRLIRVGGGTLQRPRLQIRPANLWLEIHAKQLKIQKVIPIWSQKQEPIQIRELFVFGTVSVCSVFVICVSVSWKILLLDVVNLECLSEQLFGDNHPLAVTLVLLQFQTEYLGEQKIKGPERFSVDSLYVFHRKMI